MSDQQKAKSIETPCSKCGTMLTLSADLLNRCQKLGLSIEDHHKSVLCEICQKQKKEEESKQFWIRHYMHRFRRSGIPNVELGDDGSLRNSLDDNQAKKLKLVLESAIGAYICGPPGRGKSLLLFHIIWHFVVGMRIESARAIRFDSFLGELRRRQSFEVAEEEGDPEEYLDEISDLDILGINDFLNVACSPKESDWAKRLIDERWERQKLTFITSNLDLDAVERTLDARTVDRILHMAIPVILEGPNYRELTQWKPAL